MLSGVDAVSFIGTNQPLEFGRSLPKTYVLATEAMCQEGVGESARTLGHGDT